MDKKTCLLVLDMLRDFIEPNGKLYCGETAREIVPRVKKLIERFRREKQTVIYVCDAHIENDPEFRMFPPHAVGGTPGAEVIPELAPQPGDVVLKKRRYDAFYGTELDTILKSERFDEVHVTGVCTSICVMETVQELANREIPSVVYADAVADFDAEEHQHALKRMKRLFGARIV